MRREVAAVPYFVGPKSIIQSDFRSSDHGNLEAVLWKGGSVDHYFGIAGKNGMEWKKAQQVSPVATGPASIIQSSFRSGDDGNFEVVVLEGNELVHYWHDNSNVALPWSRAQVISTRATGPGCIIQSSFRSGDDGNFEVVVLEGNELVHYWHDNSNVALPWSRAQVTSVAATGPGSLIQSSYGPGGEGNFEVIVQECEQSVVHYWHHNVDPSLPWWRASALLAE